MITDLLISLTFLIAAIVGLQRPHLSLCLLLWVDLTRPQTTSYSFLADSSLSLYVALIFFASLILGARRLSLPKERSYQVLVAIMMIWFTITTLSAQFPAVAWNRYDSTIKTLLVILFIPFVLNTKARIEAVLWTIVLSAGYFCTMAGLKTLAGGGGYKSNLLLSMTSHLTESSTLSAVAVALLPLIAYLYKYSDIAVKHKYVRWAALAYGVLFLLTVVGTHARTGLAALAVLCVMYAVFFVSLYGERWSCSR